MCFPQLSSMGLFTTARLSVQRVTPAEWDFILSLEGASEDVDEATGNKA